MDKRARDLKHDFVVVGTVTKPHGIKGELCVYSYVESPSFFSDIPGVYLRMGRARPEPHTITAWRRHKGRVLMTLKGVADRNRAEELRGMEVSVLRGDMPTVDDDEVYLHDILGFIVVLEDGTELGSFVHFLETPAGEVWSIDNPKGEIMLPAVDEVILDIDMHTRRITVNPPEGLLDIYLKDDK